MNSIKYKFKWAGDLIDYLETPVKEIEELVQKLKLTKLKQLAPLCRDLFSIDI